MRKIISITQVSLDGVMQAPGGPDEDTNNGFPYGGWAMRGGDEAIGAALADIMSGPFELLLGRRTYDIFASYWPLHDDNFIGKAFNGAEKYVVTGGTAPLLWQRSHAIGGDVAAGIRRIKETAGPDLHVWGSGQLHQLLAAEALVDEYRLWVHPVVLGQGKRLFESGTPPGLLELVATKRSSMGVLLNTYRPGGALKTGPA